ncbi:MAG TPA: MFS transporter [Bryobacteraceae bacterium]|nr:MFS transporter [Bryobacteraceae bacterium]
MRYKWAVVGMLWGISFFNYADRQAVFSVFPLLEKELHLNSVQLGLLGSSFALTYGICAMFAGAVVDRVRRVSAILWGLYVWSLICVATAVSRTFPQLLAFRAAEGLGETLYFPASMSLISGYHGRETRSRAMGLHQTSVYIGTVAGGFFAGLVGQRYGWRWSFVAFGGAGILLGAVLHRFLREPEEKRMPVSDRGGAGASAREFGLLLRRPTVLCLMGAFLCANFVAVVLLSWMPKFLHDRFHLNLAMAGLTATIFAQLASMLGSPVGGWLADRLRRRMPGGRLVVQAIGVFAGAPFVLLCGMTESIGWLVVALTFWGFAKGLYDANIFASVYDVIPAQTRGSAAGLMNTVGWLGGGAAAPLTIGILANTYGLGVAIALTSAVYLAAGAFLVTAITAFVKSDQEPLS